MKLKRLLSILVSILILMTAIPLGAVSVGAVSFDELNSSSMFFKQKYNDTCTLAATAMMMRRYSRLRGDAGWSSITESAIRPTAWNTQDGLYWSFSYSNDGVKTIKVRHYDLPGGEANESLIQKELEQSPEGIVIYNESVPHAVLLTDYTDGKYYCADPLSSSADGRILLTSSYKVRITNVTAYWKVTSAVVPGPNPTLTIQYNANGGSIDGKVIGDNYKVTDSAGLNMRKDAGVNKAKVTALPKGATFTVKTGDTKTADGYTWGKTTYGSYTGWVVISDFVEKTGSARSSEYYLSSSLVYRASNNKVLTQVMTYGQAHIHGLWNAASFPMYRTGYQFVGWCADADGSSTIFGQDDLDLKPENIYPALQNGSATITLYAIWEISECAHIPEIIEQGYDATCTEEGLTDGIICSICGTVLAEQEAIPVLEHAPILLEGYDATCTEDGLTEGAECALCGEILVEQEIIYAEDHQIVIIEGYDATCTEDGLSEGEVCTVCGEVLVEQEIIYAYDHDIEYLEGYEPTCTEDGLSEGEVCIVCGEVLVEQEILPATGHEADIIYGYEPTCTEEGLTDGEECWYCGEILVEQQVIPMVPHEPYTVDGYEPTCTEEGLTDGEECYWCGEVLVEQQPIPMVSHEPYTVDGYEPTCTEEGLTDGEECYWCGEVLVEQQPIPMVSHEPYTVDGYEPTCTEEGLTDGEECWYCGEILVEQQVIPMIPHDIVIIEGYDATCTEDGITDGKECALCGEVFVEQEDIYAYGHSYTDRYDAECNECGETREVPDRPGQPDQPPTPDLPDDAPAFVVESVTAREGEEVAVAIRTEKNSGIVSLNLMLSYDDNMLELIAVEGGDFANAVFSPLTNNPVIINWVDAIHPNNTTNGVVALLIFRVKDGTPVGKTAITLTYDAEDVYDQNFDNVAFRVENGGVEIVEYTLGDVNGDGKINNKDLGLLQRHLADWGVEIDLPACDVNADGRVNNKDLGRLQQYLADWDVTLG